jgi:hypothetical protein
VKSFWCRRGIVLTAVSIAALVSSGAVSPSAGSAVSAEAVTPFGFTGGAQTYTVPTDGSVCSITVDAAGANGGDALPVSGTTGVGGTGGQVTATFAVSPGDTATLIVGGKGGAGADDVVVNPGGPGGFGGGAPGGSSTGVGHGAAGGGGATTVQINGVTALVAGGGGGGGVSIGGAQGGAGGSSGSDGSFGIGGAGTGLPPHGEGGLGGTTTAGGTGGPSGGGGALAGGNGVSGAGGSGGNGDVDSGAGGGGGGGFFGGGGGGGATASGAGGGGGGGAGFAAPNATGVGVGTLVQDVAGNGQAVITPAAGDCAILTVQKVVHGAVPAGTTFRVHVQCSHNEVDGVSAQALVTTVDRDLLFDAAGQPTAGTVPTVAAQPTDTCNVSETGTGNALSVAYGCTDNHTSGSALCQTSGRDVTYLDGLGQRATVTVTNTFADPAASPLVTITPRFTG